MPTKIIAIDLAKDVFEVAVANKHYRVVERHRFDRSEMRRFLIEFECARVLMESCGSAHNWARLATGAGHHVHILPARYVAPYRRRGKTDRIDVGAMLEADRSGTIKPVPVCSVEQQQIQQLHRAREQWKMNRTQRINRLRGFLAELGHVMPKGASNVPREALRLIEEADIPPVLCETYTQLREEIIALSRSIQSIEKQLHALTRDRDDVQRLQQIPGIGLLTSTALVASVGSPHRFPSGRKLASWIGLTPKENSSGNKRRLGRITKQGDTHVRTLLVHGARSVLARAKQVQRHGKPLDPLQHWV